MSAVRALPTCRRPVGDGAKRRTGGDVVSDEMGLDMAMAITRPAAFVDGKGENRQRQARQPSAQKWRRAGGRTPDASAYCC